MDVFHSLGTVAAATRMGVTNGNMVACGLAQAEPSEPYVAEMISMVCQEGVNELKSIQQRMARNTFHADEWALIICNKKHFKLQYVKRNVGWVVDLLGYWPPSQVKVEQFNLAYELVGEEDRSRSPLLPQNGFARAFMVTPGFGSGCCKS